MEFEPLPNRQSNLKNHPKSQVLERGYINVYSNLNSKERRALSFNRKYKASHPNWDNTSIRLCQEFSNFLIQFRNQGKQDPIVLDAGCGRGNYVIDEYRNKISWASGVDLKLEFTDGNICLDEIRHASLEEIPYADNTFDAVTCLWVLEHVQNPIQVLQEIHRVLKPGGSFIYCTPNKRSLLVRTRLIVSSKVVDFFNKEIYGRENDDVFPALYRSNDLKTISRQLLEAGFKSGQNQLNYDPGYTGFNNLTFTLSSTFESVVGRIAPSLSRPHIVGHAIA